MAQLRLPPCLAAAWRRPSPLSCLREAARMACRSSLLRELFIQMGTSGAPAGWQACSLSGGRAAGQQRSPPGGSVPVPSSCPLAAALPCRCRQHSTYGSGTLDLSTGALSDTETDKKAISALVAVSRRPLAFQLGAGMPAAAGLCILPWRSVLTAVRHRCIAIMSTCPSLHCTRPPSLPPYPPALLVWCRRTSGC
jgi:hypothetical protein